MGDDGRLVMFVRIVNGFVHELAIIHLVADPAQISGIRDYSQNRTLTMKGQEFYSIIIVSKYSAIGVVSQCRNTSMSDNELG